MNPLWLMAPGALQTLLGIGQTIKGYMQKDEPDAKMTLPPAFIEAENRARAEASQTESPYAPYLEQMMQQNTANAVTGAKEVGTAGDVLNATAQAQYAANTGANQIGMESQKYKETKDAALNAMLGQKANLQQQMFQYNVARPEEEREAYKSAMIGGGMQNVMGGASSAMSTAYSALMQNELMKLMGNKSGVGTTNVGVNTTPVNYTLNNAPGTTVPTENQFFDINNPFQLTQGGAVEGVMSPWQNYGINPNASNKFYLSQLMGR